MIVFTLTKIVPRLRYCIDLITLPKLGQISNTVDFMTRNVTAKQHIFLLNACSSGKPDIRGAAEQLIKYKLMLNISCLSS